MKNEKARCKAACAAWPYCVNIDSTEKVHKNPSKSNQHLPVNCRVTMMLLPQSGSGYLQQGGRILPGAGTPWGLWSARTFYLVSWVKTGWRLCPITIKQNIYILWTSLYMFSKGRKRKRERRKERRRRQEKDTKIQFVTWLYTLIDEWFALL